MAAIRRFAEYERLDTRTVKIGEEYQLYDGTNVHVVDYSMMVATLIAGGSAWGLGDYKTEIITVPDRRGVMWSSQSSQYSHQEKHTAYIVAYGHAKPARIKNTKRKHGNSGRTYTFIAGINEITGDLGWQPIGLTGGRTGPAFDPVSPTMAVHDLMEHFPGQEYAPHAEYMAQGAMLWLRYEGGFFGRRATANEVSDAVVKPAFGMLFHHIDAKRLDTKELNTDYIKVAQMPATTTEVMYDLIARSASFIRVNHASSSPRLLRSLQLGIPWMQHGYHLAGRRYAGLDKIKLSNLFSATASKISGIRTGAVLKLMMNYEAYQSSIRIEVKDSVQV